MKPSAFGSLQNPGMGKVPCPPGSLEPLWWAVRALWTEMMGFRFHYPIALVSEAGSRDSLHYYVYSDQLFFDSMELDDAGVPVQRSRSLGRFYNPAYVAWYGLMALEHSLRQGDRECRAFRRQSAWLIQHAVRREDGAIVWPFPVDTKEGRCELKAPWVSAMIQGLAISALVRAQRLGCQETDLIEMCQAATTVFQMDVEEGGVRCVEEGRALYEEYPGYPPPRILDGFLFSLLGLYDLWIEASDAQARRLFDEGAAGLIHHIEYWNYQNRWSGYGSHGYPCPPHYHNLNRLLLSAIAAVTEEPTLSRYVEIWDPANLNWMERAHLFVTFTLLKNASRARAWRERR